MFTAQTANGNSAEVSWVGGSGAFVAWGTFDGATVKLQTSPDGGTTWIDVTDASLTAAGYKTFRLPAGWKLRANLASVGTTSINAYAPKLPA